MCNTFCEGGLCGICIDGKRNKSRLMIVHMPADISSMKAANCHGGLYFVLMGQVSPVQRMDISSVTLDKLVVRLQASDIEETITTTNFIAKGDATAYILAELLKNLPYKVSRLARGIPLGGEMEYVGASISVQVVYDRRNIQS